MGQAATRHEAHSSTDLQPLDLTSAAPAPAPGAPPAGTPVVPLSGEKGEAERPASPASNGEPMAATGACHSVNLRNSLSKMRWTASSLDSLKAAEAKLLDAVGGLRVFDTDIGNGQHVHTVEGGKGKTELPVVMCHGYGMGVGGWHLNLAELTASTHVLAKDWLGCGLSARPKWDANGVEETEAFFVDSLERWREANGVKKMILCGHSLGGYLAVAYAEKHPERLDRLILASPVGFPDEPEGFREAIDKRPFSQRNLMKFLGWGWAKGITPGDVVRTMGPMGYKIMMGYSQRRFQSAEFDRKALGDYLYHNLAATHGSGERALSQILKPGAWAHSPLKHRLPQIDPSIPVHFMFGEHDWMTSTAPQECKAAAEEGGTGQQITITQVPNSGHQLFLDNPRGFNAELLRVCGVTVDHAAADAAYASTMEAVASMSLSPELEV